MKVCSFLSVRVPVKKYPLGIIAALLFLSTAFPQSTELLAGFRASRIYSSFPGNQFPNENYWIRVGEGLSGKFQNSSPSSLWIVSLYQGEGKTRMSFPDEGNSIKDVLYATDELNEQYLERFDKENFKIFLQIEPGDADVVKLIHLVLKKYGKHSCIAGFGIDVEWLNPEQNQYGRKVTNDEAMLWETIVKSYNPEFKLFIKHFFHEWMPPTYRGDIIFVDDSQEFTSLSDMVESFKEWSDNMNGGKVAFQYGYPVDENWWKDFNDPAKAIGDNLLSSIPNIAGLFWVDFSVTSIFPMNPTSVNKDFPVTDFRLSQNYPNPFNPSTKIKYDIKEKQFVSLKVFNIIGNEVATIVNEEKPEGTYEAEFNASGLASGIYFYKLTAGAFNETKRMLFLK